MKHPIFKRVEELFAREKHVHVKVWTQIGPNLCIRVEAGANCFESSTMDTSKEDAVYSLALQWLDELYPREEQKPIEPYKEWKCPNCLCDNVQVTEGGLVCAKCKMPFSRDEEVKQCCQWCGSEELETHPCEKGWWAACENEKCAATGPTCETKEEALDRFIRGTK